MRIQKRLASKILKASPKRIKFSNQRLADIKEAITKTDIRALIDEKAIKKVQKKGTSKGRARKLKIQKSKGQRKGKGSKEGSRGARIPRKREWINKIRSQRELIKSLRQKNQISNETFRMIYRKAKGGYFRSKRHIIIFLTDNKLLTNENKLKEDNKPKENKSVKDSKSLPKIKESKSE